MSYVYPEKFMRDNVVALFLLLSAVVVTLPFFSTTFTSAFCTKAFGKQILSRPVKLYTERAMACFAGLAEKDGGQQQVTGDNIAAAERTVYDTSENVLALDRQETVHYYYL